MTLLDKARKMPMPQKGSCSEEELDLLIAFVNGDIKAVQLAMVLGFKGGLRTGRAYNWAASKLKHAIRMKRVSLQRR